MQLQRRFLHISPPLVVYITYIIRCYSRAGLRDRSLLLQA